LTIDGNLSDWGMSGDLTPNPGIYFTIEDWAPDPAGRIGPGFGRQAFDAEILAASWNSNDLHIALTTGHNLLNDPNNIGAGDFQLNFFTGGVNAQGLPTNVVSQYAIETGVGNAVGLYKTVDADWGQGIWNPAGSPPDYGPSNQSTSLLPGQGNLVGAAIVAVGGPQQNISPYDGDPNNAGFFNDGRTHYFYEVMVSVADLGPDWTSFLQGQQGLNIHWTTNNGDDTIELNLAVPEPASWVQFTLVLLSLAGCLALRTKHRRAYDTRG
jgi:hypothetical protein